MVLLVLAMSPVTLAQPEVVLGPVTNPTNGHLYYLLEPSDWAEARDQALLFGGDLATVNDQEENDWICETFGQTIPTAKGLWIGLNDAHQEGLFQWVSEEVVGYTNWEAGQPDNLGNEDYVHIWTPEATSRQTCRWNDFYNTPSFPVAGVVEVMMPRPPAALDIIGPENIVEGSSTPYRALVFYEDDTSTEVTAVTDWSVEPDGATNIDAHGVLHAENLDRDTTVTLRATYTEAEETVHSELEIHIRALCPRGSALQFDGNNDFFEILGYPGVTGMQARRVSAWIKTTDVNGDIIGWGSRSIGGDKWLLRTQNNDGITGAIRLEVQDGFIVGATVVTDNQWHHVAAVMLEGAADVQDVKLYVDGQLEETSAVRAHTIDSTDTANVGIGAFLGSPSLRRHFKGFIDEVRIWDVGLTGGEIQANMHSPLVGSEAGLIAYWGFDEEQGQVAHDLSAGAHDGFLGSDSVASDTADPLWVPSDAPVGFCDPFTIAVTNLEKAIQGKTRH